MRERGLHWHLHPYVAHGCEEAIKVSGEFTTRGLSGVRTLINSRVYRYSIVDSIHAIVKLDPMTQI